MNFYDYLVIALYFAFMIAVGMAFRHASKDTSDFLRGGGSFAWWMSGSQIFMSTFSAWTFVGYAGKVNAVGTYPILIFACNILSMFILSLGVAARFRRLRIQTAVEAIRDRFGPRTEQFFAWVTIPIQFAFGAVSLYAVSIFVAPILGVDERVCTVVVGVTIVLITVLGGAWAVAAGNFVQLIILAVVVTIVTVRVLALPEIGGVSGLIEKTPPFVWDWTSSQTLLVLTVWAAGNVVNSLATLLNVANGGSGFLMVRGDRDAKLAARFVGAGYIIGPMIWTVPPLAALILFPDLASRFPYLKNAEEGAFAAVSMAVLPSGMIGLIICAIFAATMSSLDNALTRGTGIFVRSIYHRVFRPLASDTELLWAARFFMGAFGTLLIGLALGAASLDGISIFDLVLQLAGLLGMPLTIPMVYGIFFKRTPPWTAWSTVLVGFLVAGTVRFVIPSPALGEFWGVTDPSVDNLRDIGFGSLVLAVWVACTLWFFGSRFFYRPEPAETARTEDMFTRLATPVEPGRQTHPGEAAHYRRIGSFCLYYGVAMLAGMLIPNPLDGRLCFLIVAAVMFTFGGILRGVYREVPPASSAPPLGASR
jgi:Na+/proline symporter